MTGSLNVTVFAVFIKPLPLGDMEGYQCGWGVSFVRDSFKVAIFDFAVFPKLLVVGEVTSSMCFGAARLGTLNCSVPNHSYVVYESRMHGLVASSKT